MHPSGRQFPEHHTREPCQQWWPGTLQHGDRSVVPGERKPEDERDNREYCDQVEGHPELEWESASILTPVNPHLLLSPFLTAIIRPHNVPGPVLQPHDVSRAFGYHNRFRAVLGINTVGEAFQRGQNWEPPHPLTRTIHTYILTSSVHQAYHPIDRVGTVVVPQPYYNLAAYPGL